ncbi:LexA repressor [uncultured Anaerotruncus sp.]|uniref:LexA repressor n=1 Tax=uncultured Anaerotruncus sp. TaxID=905011 RepID=A0A6N2UJD1_9FIRM
MAINNNAREIFARNLNRLAEQRGITQSDIAATIPCSASTASDWFAGNKYPRPDKMQKIADLLGVYISDLTTDTTLPANAIPYNPTQKIPILGRVSAGLPLYAEQHIEGYTFTTLNHGGEYFALRVEGDSMTAARINDGDLVIVRRQDIVENGELAVVLVDDDFATIKRYSRSGDTVVLTPQSYNPEHSPQIYNLKNTRIKILGKVVEIIISL